MTKKSLSCRLMRKALGRTVIISLIFSLLYAQVFAKGNSIQDLNPKISLRVVNMPVKNVLKQINKATKISFVFSNAIVTNQAVSIDVKNEELNAVLKKIFEPLGMAFSISGNVILIDKKPVAPPEAAANKV